MIDKPSVISESSSITQENIKRSINNNNVMSTNNNFTSTILNESVEGEDFNLGSVLPHQKSDKNNADEELDIS